MEPEKSRAQQGNDVPQRPMSAPGGVRQANRKGPGNRPNSAGNHPRNQNQVGPPMPVLQQINDQEENAAYSTRLVLRPKPVDYQQAVLVERGEPIPPPPPPFHTKNTDDEDVIWLPRRRDPLYDFKPCVHLLFNSQVTPREGLTRKQHLDLLAAPREIPWREIVEPDPTLYKYRRSKPSYRLPAMAVPSKRYLRGCLRDNYAILSRPRVQRLVDMLQEEMHVSNKGTSTTVEFLDPAGNVLERRPLKPIKPGFKDKATDLVAATAIRKQSVLKSKRLRKWAATVGLLVGKKILDWLQEPTIVKQSGRLQALAAAALVRLRELASGGDGGDGDGDVPRPRGAANDFLEMLAERLALWMNGVLRRSASEQDMRVVAHLRRDHFLRCERPAELGAGFDDSAVRMPDGLWWYPKPLPPQPEVYPPRHCCFVDSMFNRDAMVPSAGSRPPKVPESFPKPHDCLSVGAPEEIKYPRSLSPDEIYKNVYKRYPRKAAEIPTHDCLGIPSPHASSSYKYMNRHRYDDTRKKDDGWETEPETSKKKAGARGKSPIGGGQRKKHKPSSRSRSSTSPSQLQKGPTRTSRQSDHLPSRKLRKSKNRPSAKSSASKLKSQKKRRAKGEDRGETDPHGASAKGPPSGGVSSRPPKTQKGVRPSSPAAPSPPSSSATPYGASAPPTRPPGGAARPKTAPGDGVPSGGAPASRAPPGGATATGKAPPAVASRKTPTDAAKYRGGASSDGLASRGIPTIDAAATPGGAPSPEGGPLDAGPSGAPYPDAPPSGDMYPGGPPEDDTYPGAAPSDDAYPGAPPSDDTYSGSPPSDDTYPVAPPSDDMYPGAVPSDDTYPDAPPSDDTYSGVSPSGDTYPGEVPSDDTYPGAPPSGAPYPGASSSGAVYPGAPCPGDPCTGAPPSDAPYPGAPPSGALPSSVSSSNAPYPDAPYPGVPSSGAPYLGATPSCAPYPGDPCPGTPCPGASLPAAPYPGAPPGASPPDAPHIGKSVCVKREAGPCSLIGMKPVLVVEDEADNEPDYFESEVSEPSDIVTFGPTRDMWEEFVYHINVLGQEGCLEVDRLDVGHPIPNCILREREEEKRLASFFPPGYTDVPCCESYDTDVVDVEEYEDIEEAEKEEEREEGEKEKEPSPCTRVPAGFAPKIWKDPAERTCRDVGKKPGNAAARLLSRILNSMPVAIRKAAQSPVTELRRRLSGFLFGYLKQLIDGNRKIGPASQDIAGMVSDEVAAWLENICLDAKRACDTGLDSDTASKKITEAMEVFYHRWEGAEKPECTCTDESLPECSPDCTDTCAKIIPNQFNPTPLDSLIGMTACMN